MRLPICRRCLKQPLRTTRASLWITSIKTFESYLTVSKSIATLSYLRDWPLFLLAGQSAADFDCCTKPAKWKLWFLCSVSEEAITYSQDDEETANKCHSRLRKHWLKTNWLVLPQHPRYGTRWLLLLCHLVCYYMHTPWSRVQKTVVITRFIGVVHTERDQYHW